MTLHCAARHRIAPSPRWKEHQVPACSSAHTARKGRPIYENQYTLPVAYTYDTVLPVSSLEDKSPMEKQEITLHAAIIDDENVKACSNLKQTLKTPLLSHEIPCRIKYRGTHVKGSRLIIDRFGGSIKLTFKSDPNSETYVIYSGLIKKLDEGRPQIKRVKIKSGDTRYTYHFRLDAYKTDQDKREAAEFIRRVRTELETLEKELELN